jgi:hypothetical protein
MLAFKKMARRGPMVPTQKARRANTFAQLWSLYLVILWNVMFLYGVKEIVEGKLSLNSALPAGAFLLFFIAIFAMGLYRTWQASTSRIALVNEC